MIEQLPVRCYFMSTVNDGLYGAILVPFRALTAGVDVYAWVGRFAVDRGVESVICNFNIMSRKLSLLLVDISCVNCNTKELLKVYLSNINCSALSTTMNMSSTYLQYTLGLRWGLLSRMLFSTWTM